MKPRLIIPSIIIIIIAIAIVKSVNTYIRDVIMIAGSFVLFWMWLIYSVMALYLNRWDIWHKSEPEEDK